MYDRARIRIVRKLWQHTALEWLKFSCWPPNRATPHSPQLSAVTTHVWATFPSRTRSPSEPDTIPFRTGHDPRRSQRNHGAVIRRPRLGRCGGTASTTIRFSCSEVLEAASNAREAAAEVAGGGEL